MKDYIVRAIAADGQIRAFAATTKNMVEEARTRHNMSPIATTALGRLMTGGAMMGTMMKSDADVLTIQIKGNGPIGQMTVTADAKGRVKGFVANPEVMLPLKDGKLDVAGAVGIGVLSVIKDIGLKEPYVGDTILITSEIADDLTYYFATSEQVPSSVGLGVLMNKDNTVHEAGGFIIQLMPDATEELIDKLEQRIKEITSVTEMLEQGMTPEEILNHILGDMNLEILDTVPTEFYCNCSKDRVSKAVMSIGAEELQKMIDDDKPIEVNCHFCNSHYTFTVEELKQMLEAVRRSKVIEMRRNLKNIILIGMPGSGKSTIGVVLAKKMGYQFIDSDIVIQQKYEKTLEQLIDEHSDAGFIQIENDVNKEIKAERTVIATGGSVVYGREAMEYFKKTGVVVYLKVPEEELKKRLGSLKERGVVSNGKATIAEIFEDRKALYEQYADITVTCANEMLRYSVEDVYAKINAYFAENYVTKE